MQENQAQLESNLVEMIKLARTGAISKMAAHPVDDRLQAPVGRHLTSRSLDLDIITSRGDELADSEPWRPQQVCQLRAARTRSTELPKATFGQGGATVLEVREARTRRGGVPEPGSEPGSGGQGGVVRLPGGRAAGHRADAEQRRRMELP